MAVVNPKYDPNASSAIADTDALPEGSSNLYFTTQRTRDTPLTGLSTATAAPVTADDAVLTAAGKLQRQATDNAALLPPFFETAWYKSGLYYDAVYPYFTTISPTTGGGGVLYWCKRRILDDVTFDELSVNVTTAAASSSVSYGVYASDASGLPSKLLVSGEASGDTTGVKSTAVTLNLAKGQVVWDAYLNTGAAVGVTAFQPIFKGGAVNPTANGTTILTRSGQTSLPADASVIGAFSRSTTTLLPRVALRAA